jgi:hypothetical protein
VLHPPSCTALLIRWVAGFLHPPPGLQFLSRPFVAGDVVQFNGPGSMTVAGVVDKVAPMRVMLRTDDGAVVSIPNKVGGAGGR